MKILANDLLHLLDGIDPAEITDNTVNLAVMPLGIIFSWQESERQIVYLIKKKSGIVPASLSTGQTYCADSFALLNLGKIISSQAIEFAADKQDFLVDFDFEIKKFRISVTVTDSNGLAKTIQLKEVFNTFKLPDKYSRVAYTGSYETVNHLRLAKYVAECGNHSEVFLEFLHDRFKISGLSKEVFMGGVVMDYAEHDFEIEGQIGIDIPSVSSLLKFKNYFDVKWQEYPEHNLTMMISDGSVTTPYWPSSVEIDKYSQHLISNKAEGWVNCDRNLLIKQLESVCNPVVLTESSAILPIKSISQFDNNEFVVETDDRKVKTSGSMVNQIIEGIALLESWGFPSKDSFYNNIVELELKAGNLHITGYDGRKRKINLRSSPNATGYWRGDGKKLIKILNLFGEYDSKVQIVLDHPRLQIQSVSGASILILGCDLTDDDNHENNTPFKCLEKRVIVFPEIENEHLLDVNEIFTQRVFQLHQLRQIVERVDGWVDDILVDPNQLEKLCDLIDKAKILIDFIPEDKYIPDLEECFDGVRYTYGHIAIADCNIDSFFVEIETLLYVTAHAVGKVMQCYCELPSLMQYQF